jgi:hypothetical protein
MKPWTVRLISGSHGSITGNAECNLHVTAPGLTMGAVESMTRAAPGMLAALREIRDGADIDDPQALRNMAGLAIAAAEVAE